MAGNKNIKHVLFISLTVGCAQMSATGLSAQGLATVPDSALAHKSTPALQYATKQPTDGYSVFMKSVAGIPHQLNLAKGFSIQTNSFFSSPFSAMNSIRNGGTPDPMSMTSLRRPDLGLNNLRFGMDNFTFGASYNGLNNLTRGGGFSGGAGQGTRNTGLSIHAGLRF
jgi:hypothetical protein